MKEGFPGGGLIPGVRDADLRDLFFAAGAFFDGVYAVDLAENAYTAIKQTDGSHAPRHGAYDTLVGALSAIAHPEDRDCFRARLSRDGLQCAFAGGAASVAQQVRAARADGGYQWLSAEAVRVLAAGGRGARAVLFVRPIDAQKRLMEREAMVRALLGHSAAGRFENACIIDAHLGVYTLYSGSLAAAVGLPETGDYDEAVRYVQTTLVPESHRKAFEGQMRLSAVLSRLNESGPFQYRFRLADTQEQRWREAEFCYLDSDKREVVITLRDVHAAWLQEQARLSTEERQKQILAEALAIARRESGVKRKFLSGVSDALRDPINIILGMSHVANAAPDDPACVRHCLETIDTASRSLLALITDLLDIARTDSAAAAPAAIRFPLRSVEEDAAFVTRQGKLKGIDISADLSELPDLSVTGDREALSKILRNIGENAVTRTPPGGTVRLRAVQQYRNGSMLVARFITADSGPGMDQQHLQRLFEPFQSGEGVGLGMAISKRYADQIGATIDVRSKPGEGCTITVDIPLEVAPNDLPQAVEQGGVASESVALAGCRVLLAEDSELNAEIAIALLGLHGITVDHAINGEAAVARYHAHPPFYYHAVLMDIQMPVLGGMEATRAIRGCGREDSGTLPIIAMSANAFQENLTRALQSGMDDYITKPFELERLLSSLRTHIAQR